MFTEGLDSHALRWVQKEHAPVSKVQQRMHAIRDIRTSGWGIDIPPPEKFKSGHLPSGSIPISYAVHLDGDSDLGSNMDESSDTEESSSSPHDGMSTQSLRNGASPANNGYHRYTNSVAQHHYSSDGYSGYSSSRDTAQQRPLHPRKTLDVSQHDEQGEWSDSGDSLVFNGQLERNSSGKGLPLSGGTAIDSACCMGDSNSNTEKDSLNAISGKQKHSNIPSAPPFNGYEKEFSQDDEELSFTNARHFSATSQVLNGLDANSEDKTPNKLSRNMPSGFTKFWEVFFIATSSSEISC